MVVIADVDATTAMLKFIAPTTVEYALAAATVNNIIAPAAHLIVTTAVARVIPYLERCIKHQGELLTLLPSQQAPYLELKLKVAK